MNVVSKILYDTILNAAPILFAVLGGIYAYKANVLNVALDGMMMIGAFAAALIMNITSNYPFALFVAIISSCILAFIFCYLGITLNGNVIIIGLAINMLVNAAISFALKIMKLSDIVVQTYVPAVHRIKIPFFSDIPILKDVISGHSFLTYFSYLLIIVMWVFMYKTKTGIYIRVVGENEESAQAVGLKSNKMKYIAVLIGAVCCALGGASLSMDCVGGMFVENITSGRGFIAIAAIYCGDGAPVRSAGFALLFGFMRALALNLGIYISSAARIFNLLPYLIIIIMLLSVSISKNRNNMVRGKYEI